MAFEGKEGLFEPKLFQKHLSKLSIGPLMELCRGVGKTFRAVSHSHEPDTNSGNALLISNGQATNLMSDIARLKRELKRFKRKKDGLARQNKRQRMLITKFKSIAHGILQAASDVSA